MPPLRMPELILIGAMKGGTSALHRYLDDHPDIAMSGQKELNFFFGGDQPPSATEDVRWHAGNWHRGVQWYAGQFDASAPVRGESSPGYTSPSHPEAAARIAATAPGARLVYLVRDPLSRAVSQYLHHFREGSEQRPLHQAVFDPSSQYISRSRYFERLSPFLNHFPAQQILVVAQEDFLHERRSTMKRVYAFVGADPRHWSDSLLARWHTHEGTRVDADDAVRERFMAAVRDDVERLRSWASIPLPSWSI